MATNAYYTYSTLMTPGHADIEALLEGICTVIPVERIKVHAQTINVLDITRMECIRINTATEDLVEGNVLRTTIYEPGEESDPLL